MSLPSPSSLEVQAKTALENLYSWAAKRGIKPGTARKYLQSAFPNQKFDLNRIEEYQKVITRAHAANTMGLVEGTELEMAQLELKNKARASIERSPSARPSPAVSSRTDLHDIAFLRLRELSRKLAGAAAVSPLAVLPIASKVKSRDIFDDNVRYYLAQLIARLPELQTADELRRAEICAEAAWQVNCPIEYTKWLAVTDFPAEECAGKAIEEIRLLTTGVVALERIKQYAIENSEYLGVTQ